MLVAEGEKRRPFHFNLNKDISVKIIQSEQNIYIKIKSNLNNDIDIEIINDMNDKDIDFKSLSRISSI